MLHLTEAHSNPTGFRLKGILNMHVNIRSLRNKMEDIKALIYEKTPHVMGAAKCELTKCAVG